MAEKELRRLKRRDLLRMLLMQCEEAERLQQETDAMKEKMEVILESYERLKKKLDVKDERLNQKDAKIAELKSQIEEMKAEQETEVAGMETRRKRKNTFRNGQVVSIDFGQQGDDARRTAEPVKEKKKNYRVIAAASGELHG